MRQITPTLPAVLAKNHRTTDVAKGRPYRVDTYRELVRVVANLAYLNPDHLLFYRGQGVDYANKAGASTFYPSIYRTDPLPKNEIVSRFRRLKFQGQRLAQAFKTQGVSGAAEIAARELLQWSIIQHYEIGETPLLDVTHSLSVACSFAQDSRESERAYIYVFGLPHISNRISVNSEHDTINIRLLSICPPDALRPYFQEGYLLGTWDVTENYNDKTSLDFNRRLMAKFSIPTSSSFWGKGFGRIPRDLLYPDNDIVQCICSGIGANLAPDAGPDEVGSLLLAWQDIERILLSAAADRARQITSVHKAIQLLEKGHVISQESAQELDTLRQLRNSVVHGKGQLSSAEMDEVVSKIARLTKLLRTTLRKRRLTAQ